MRTARKGGKTKQRCCFVFPLFILRFFTKTAYSQASAQGHFGCNLLIFGNLPYLCRTDFMKNLRQLPFLHRLFCLLMAINVLNFSIDAPDHLTLSASQNTGAEDLSVNKMESIGEVLLEKVLAIPDAVPERDDPDHPIAVKLVKTVYDWTAPTVMVPLQKIPISFSLLIPRKYFFTASFYSSHSPEIDSPPPQRA